MEILGGRIVLTDAQERQVKSLVVLRGKILRPLGVIIRRLEDEVLHQLAKRPEAAGLVSMALNVLEAERLPVDQAEAEKAGAA